MDQIINRYKALSDETRLRILLLLSKRELCVCQLQGILEESQPKISKHLRKLKDLNAVWDLRKDQFVYYALNQEDTLLLESLSLLCNEIPNNEVLARDQKRLEMAEKFLSQCSSLTKIEVERG